PGGLAAWAWGPPVGPGGPARGTTAPPAPSEPILVKVWSPAAVESATLPLLGSFGHAASALVGASHCSARPRASERVRRNMMASLEMNPPDPGQPASGPRSDTRRAGILRGPAFGTQWNWRPAQVQPGRPHGDVVPSTLNRA